MVDVPRKNKPPKENPRERDWVDQDWKDRVWAELRRRDWSPERLADEIAWSRSGVYKLLNTRQRSSGCVSLIESKLSIPRNRPPKEDPLRQRFDELSGKLSADDARLIMQMMEKLAKPTDS